MRYPRWVNTIIIYLNDSICFTFYNLGMIKTNQAIVTMHNKLLLLFSYQLGLCYIQLGQP